MIKTIEQGDKLECLFCKSAITVSHETFWLDSEGEYIECPNCKRSFDVQAYHLYGKKLEEE